MYYTEEEIKERVNRLIMEITAEGGGVELAKQPIERANDVQRYVQPREVGEVAIPVEREVAEVENGVALGGILGGVLGAGVGAVFPAVFGTTSALFGAFSGFIAGGSLGATIGGLLANNNNYIKPSRKKERPTYGFNAGDNLAVQGTTIPLIYCSRRVNPCGGVRHLGLLIMNRIVNEGNYGTLYQAYALGMGELDTETQVVGGDTLQLPDILKRSLLIDGQAIENYYQDEVEVDIIRGNPTYLNPKNPEKAYPAEFRIYSQTLSPTGFNTIGTDLRSEFNKTNEEAVKTYNPALTARYNDDFWDIKEFSDQEYLYKAWDTFRARGSGLSISLTLKGGGVEVGFRHESIDSRRASIVVLPYSDAENTAPVVFWQPWADKYEPYEFVTTYENPSISNDPVRVVVSLYYDSNGRKRLKITTQREGIDSNPVTRLDVPYKWRRSNYPFIVAQRKTTFEALAIEYFAISPKTGNSEKVDDNVTDTVKTSGCDYKIFLPYPKEDTDDEDDDDNYTERQLKKDITDGVFDTFTPSEVYVAASEEPLDGGTYGYTEFRILSKTPPRTLCTSRNVSKRITGEGRIWSVWRGNYRTTKACNQVEFNLTFNLYSRPKPPEQAANSKKGGKGGKGK